MIAPLVIGNWKMNMLVSEACDLALSLANNSFEGVDYMIPGNDDSMSSIELFVKSVSQIISSTKTKFIKPSSADSKTSEKIALTDKTKTIKKKQVIDVKASACFINPPTAYIESSDQLFFSLKRFFPFLSCIEKLL